MKKKAISIALFIAIGLTQVHAANDDRTTGKKNEPVVHNNILSDKLPAKLLTSIKKDYKTYWITDLYKSTTNGKVSYHITVENADQVIQLSAAQPSGWVIKSVISKNEELTAS